mmetsp:Transcript_126670/g.352955  ORF Transcript_126670/g.352955 Transcript_126670/m.352955 type:complete len:227 (-) Transcript_126670:1627-2307(-)
MPCGADGHAQGHTHGVAPVLLGVFAHVGADGAVAIGPLRGEPSAPVACIALGQRREASVDDPIPIGFFASHSPEDAVPSRREVRGIDCLARAPSISWQHCSRPPIVHLVLPDPVDLLQCQALVIPAPALGGNEQSHGYVLIGVSRAPLADDGVRLPRPDLPIHDSVCGQVLLGEGPQPIKCPSVCQVGCQQHAVPRAFGDTIAWVLGVGADVPDWPHDAQQVAFLV